MKRTIPLLTCLFVCLCTSAQRLVPVVSSHAAWPIENISSVNDLDTLNGELLIVGAFNDLNNVEFGGFMSYNGSAMQSYGNTLDNYNLGCVHGYQGSPVVGARANSSTNFVLKWNGTEWAAMGDTLNSNVLDIEDHQGELYIAGRMDSVVMKWSGNDWTGMNTSGYERASELYSWNNRLYTVFDDSIPAFYFNNQWQVISLGEAGLNRGYNYTVLNGSLYLCGSYEINGIEHGLMRVEGTQLIIDPAVDVEETVYNALEYGGYVFCFGQSNLYRNQEAIFTVNRLSSSATLTMSEHMIRYGGEIFFACQYQGPGFFDNAASGHLYMYREGSAFAELSSTGHELSASFDANQSFFNADYSSFDNFENLDGLAFPAGDSTKVVFSASIVASAMLPDGEILCAASAYNLGADFGWIPGPVADTIDQEYVNRYLKVWKVSSTEIQNHQANFTNPNYQVPEAIATWPGNGQFDKGEAHQLAPFADLNGDGWYQPHLGEFPEILGDHAVFMMLNDKFAIHEPSFYSATSPDLKPMELELHIMFYAYDDQLPPLNRTVFMRSGVFNRSENDYQNFRIGIFNDFDLGNYFDDYTGCNTESDYVFCYNQDNFDEDYTSDENPDAQGYGDNPPATACIYLNNQIGAARSCESGVVLDLPAFPTRSDYYYRQLFEGLDNFGNEVIVEGDTMGLIMFPDSPCVIGGDHEVTYAQTGGDRIHVSSTDNVFLASGEFLCFDAAYLVTGQTSNYLDNACQLEDLVPIVRDFYTANNLGSCILNTSLEEEMETQDGILVWPNPASDRLNVRNIHRTEGQYHIFDLSGRQIKSGQINSSTEVFTIDTHELSVGLYILKFENFACTINVSR